MKKRLTLWIATLLLFFLPIFSQAQVQFGVRVLPDMSTYEVVMKSVQTWNFPQNLTGTVQITLRVPSATGVDSFTVDNLNTQVSGVSWTVNGRENAPTESADFDYISFGLSSLGVSLPYVANTETVLFQFENGGTCRGAVSIIDNASDPFMNNGRISVGNQITAFGGGYNDAFAGVFLTGSNNCEDFLPVELLNFDATPDGQTVQLSWTTAYELNNDFFTLERSLDGLTFSPLAQIKGAGTSQTNLTYGWTDERPMPGRSFYRLKQTDFDGSFSYSDQVMVQFAPGQEFTQLSLFPNPLVSGNALTVEVDWTETAPVEVSILSLEGKVLSETNRSLQGGRNEWQISATSRLAAGMYLIRLSTESQTQTARFTVF